jgi:hypothetical protein
MTLKLNCYLKYEKSKLIMVEIRNLFQTRTHPAKADTLGPGHFVDTTELKKTDCISSLFPFRAFRIFNFLFSILVTSRISIRFLQRFSPQSPWIYL